MSTLDKYHRLLSVFQENEKFILKEYDATVAKAGGKKHFIIVTDNNFEIPFGKGHSIYFRSLDYDALVGLDIDTRIAILNSENEESICVLFSDATDKVLLTKFERSVNK